MRGNRVAAVVVLCIASAAAADPPRPAKRWDSWSDRKVANTLLVTGAIIDVSALVLGAYAMSLRDDARAAGCRDDLSHCPPAALSTAGSAYDAASRATVLFGIGTIVAGVGVYLRVTAQDPRAVSVSPMIGAGAGGAMLSGSF